MWYMLYLLLKSEDDNMTFTEISDLFTYVILGGIVSFVAYVLFGVVRQNRAEKKYNKLAEIKEQKLNYLNAELAAYDLQILPKDKNNLEGGRLQSLKSWNVAGEFNLLPSDLTDGSEVYRFIFKNNDISSGVLEINIDEKLGSKKTNEAKDTVLLNKMIKDEFDRLKGKGGSVLKHSFLTQNRVEGVKGLAIASKNLVLKHTTINKTVEQFKINKGDLLIPVMNVQKEFLSYQVIDSHHNKRMRIGKSIKGGFFPVGKYRVDNEKYILCEDYLTAATLNRATGITALVAFDVQNILDVAQDLIQQNPKVELIFATSRDMLTTNKSRIKKALYYSYLFNMPFIFPKFPDGEQYDHFKTWNELNRYDNDEQIKKKVDSQVKFFKDNGKVSTIRLASDKYGIEY